MTAGTVTGINYSVQDAIVEFFGVRGCRSGTDSWAINVRTTRIDLEIDAPSTTGWIRERIQHAIHAGSGQEFTELRLGPRSAVFLFLDGGLTCEHLAGATEGDDFIEIPGVSLDGRTLAVRIVPEPKYEVSGVSQRGKSSVSPRVVDSSGSPGRPLRAGPGGRPGPARPVPAGADPG